MNHMNSVLTRPEYLSTNCNLSAMEVADTCRHLLLSLSDVILEYNKSLLQIQILGGEKKKEKKVLQRSSI